MDLVHAISKHIISEIPTTFDDEPSTSSRFLRSKTASVSSMDMKCNIVV